MRHLKTAVSPATTILVASVTCLLGVTTSCRQVPDHTPADAQWSPPVCITVQGLEGKWSLTRCGAWPICCSASDTPPVAPPGLPVRDGDYLGVSAETGSQGKAESAFLYRQSDGTTLALKLAPQRLVLHGRTVTLDLSRERQGWDWLAQAPVDQLAALRHVLLPEELGTNTETVAARTHLLRKLAAANPGVGLICKGSTNLVPRSALAGFRPRTLVIDGSTDNAAMTGLLAAFGQPSQLDTLLVGAENLTNLAFLADLPALKRLSLLGEWNPAKTGPIPATCTGLRSFSAAIETEDKMRLENLATRKSLADIESLTIMTRAGINLDNLAAYQKLREFSLWSETNVDLRPLQHLPCLTALGISLAKKADPGEFAALLKRVPGVRHLEIYALGEETNNAACLASIASLPELESLTIIGTFDSSSLPLPALRKLRFLALSSKQWETESFAMQITQFQQAHPDCRVVTCEPVCLGSGWVLVLALIAAMSFWIRARRRGVAS